MAIVGQERPDFRTISDVRKQHLAACQEVVVQVVRVAGAAGLVQVGNVSTDGPKMPGNASRHKAMSYGYRKKEVERWREDSAALVTQAYQQDEAEEAPLGSRRGKAPNPVAATPDDKAQMSLTDPELPIMRTNNKGWDDGGKAQASVDGTCQILLACDVTDAPNDQPQAEPLAQAIQANLAQAGIKRPTDESGAPQVIPATLENGYDSAAAVEALETLGSIHTWRRSATGTLRWRPRRATRQRRRRSVWRRRFAPLKVVRCTHDARSLWSPGLGRSKQCEGSAASCCVA